MAAQLRDVQVASRLWVYRTVQLLCNVCHGANNLTNDPAGDVGSLKHVLPAFLYTSGSLLMKESMVGM